MTETQFPPAMDVGDIRQHVRDALPGFNNAPPEVNQLANDVQPLLRAYDALRAENERLQGDWQLAVKIAETHALENERLRAAVTAVYLAEDADRGTALERLFDLVIGPSDARLGIR